MIHPTADVSDRARIGGNTRVWHRTQICANAEVGEDCIVGSGVYIDRDVVIGSRVKIQTGAQIYHGAVIEDGVFVGPLVCITNDTYPRAVNPDGELKTDADWVLGKSRICYGASLGAGAIVLPDVTVGRFAMVAAGSVVTKSIPDYGLAIGTPARLVGYVCACGRRLKEKAVSRESFWACEHCDVDYLKLSDNSLCPRPIRIAAESAV